MNGTFYDTRYVELYHFGVKGMKCGVRRFNNKDGTLTSNGKKRYFGNRGDVEKQIDPESVDRWMELQKEIKAKSGDWFNQIGVSKRFRDTMKWANKAKKKLEEEPKQYGTAYSKRRELEKAFKKKLESRLASTILRDLGYNDTKAGRQFLINYELLSSD